MATGKSFWASGGKNTSTAFLVNGWLPCVGWPTSTCVRSGFLPVFRFPEILLKVALTP
jgi:hypothetical protein